MKKFHSRIKLLFGLSLLSVIIIIFLINTKADSNNRGEMEARRYEGKGLHALPGGHENMANQSCNTHFPKKKVISAFYRGWTHQGNIGDNILAELINILMSQKLAERGFGFNMVDDYERCKEPLSDNHFDMFILGGGSLLRRKWLCNLQNSLTWNKPILIPGSGYDDHSCTLLNEKMYDQFQRGDVHSLTKRDPSTISMIKGMMKSHLVIGGVRGPYTYTMVLKGTNSSSLPEIGDAALLTALFYGTDPKFDAYMKFALPRDEKYIVVNIAERYRSYEMRKGLVEAAMIKVLTQLMKKYHIIIYPMFVKDLKFVRAFTLKIRLGYLQHHLFGVKHKKVECFTELLDIPKIGSIIKSAHFTINYLLHANYISAAYETPFIPLIYRMKVLDLVGSMDLWDYSVKMHNISSMSILEKVQKLMKDRNIIVKKLRAQNKKVAANLDAIFTKMAAVVTSEIF